MSRLMLALVVLLAAPAQAQILDSEWSGCVVDQLTREEALQGSVATGAVAVSIRCKRFFKGKPGEDVDDAVMLIERIRAKVSRPQPRGDMRF